MSKNYITRHDITDIIFDSVKYITIILVVHLLFIRQIMIMNMLIY